MRRLMRLCGSSLLCSALLMPWLARAQQVPQPLPPTAAQPSTPPLKPAAATAHVRPSAQWLQLSARERTALAPLAEHWGSISETQRSKWLAIARNFDQLPASEQQLMQTRMKEWVALSPVQRNQARLNFNSVQSVSRDEKKNRWEAYQNLSDEEKRKLSAGQLGPARTAAPSPRPTPSQRLVQPAVRTLPPEALPARAPIDRHTLLPVPAPTATPEPLAPASAPMDAASAPEPAASPASASEASDS